MYVSLNSNIFSLLYLCLCNLKGTIVQPFSYTIILYSHSIFLLLLKEKRLLNNEYGTTNNDGNQIPNSHAFPLMPPCF